MKKNKIGIGFLAGLSIVAPVVAVVSCGEKGKVAEVMMSEKSKIATGISLLDDGSTNIYGTHAMYPYSYTVKHAILSKNKVIFAPVKYNTTWEFQKKFNSSKFLSFKKEEKLSAIVWDDIKTREEYFDKVYEYAVKNKNEKINLFVNDARSMLGKIWPLKNVSVVFIGDSSKDYEYWKSGKHNYWGIGVKQKRDFRHERDIYLADSNSLILKEDSNIIKSNNITEMQDRLFATKSIGKIKKRLFSIYNEISGFDYKESLKILKNISKNGKPTLLVLGSYAGKGYVERSEKFISWIVDKYKDKYNIFYKGHPGHNYVTNNVLRNINNGENDVLKQKIHILNTFLPSEELTNNHISEGMRFDKFIAAGATSALSKIANGANGYNKYTDILGYWKDTSKEFSGTLDVWVK